MENKIDGAQEILSHGISGFHRYVLEDPVRLCFVSRNLCEMLGLREDELLGAGADLYAEYVHADDREAYLEFIAGLKSGEQTLSAQYRLVKGDGSVICVNDTVTARRLADGTLVGDSVLSDITELKRENDALKFLNDTVPSGFIRYTCEEQPRITYINGRMLEFLGFDGTEESDECLRMYRGNIFLMIPMDERRKFARYLKRVYTASSPVAGELSVLRCDGSRAYLFGWVTKCLNGDGVEEFQSVCMDVTERHMEKKQSEAKRYIDALAEIYDMIFEYDLTNDTVNCLHSSNSPTFGGLENIHMQMEDATERWIAARVVPKDLDRVRAFFRDFRQRKLYAEGRRPPQITYMASSSDGEVRIYSGIFLKMDSSVSLYCCRCVPDTASAEALRAAYDSLKEDMQGLIMHFTDGIAAFEVKDGLVTPLYASENVCGFFGYAREEWLSSMKSPTPIRDFVSRSDASYEDIERLLRTGEAEFSYFDIESGKTRRIKAVCSGKSPEAASPRYVMLYNVDETEREHDDMPVKKSTVTVRTFGYFDVFIDQKPIAFRNKKSKELFALLVDRRGGFVSSEEAISFLWEDEAVSPVTLARYRKVVFRLRNTLEEHGIADVMESVDGKHRIVMERVQCDLYDYLSGRPEYAHLFKGSYLTNYSWGENTLAQLTGKILY